MVDQVEGSVIATPDQVGDVVTLAALLGISAMSAWEIRTHRAAGVGFRATP